MVTAPTLDENFDGGKLLSAMQDSLEARQDDESRTSMATPNTHHTLPSTPKARSASKKKKQPLKEQLTLWLVPPQNLAIESCCFQLGRRTTTAKLVPQIGQTPWHTTKHGPLLIGR